MSKKARQTPGSPRNICSETEICFAKQHKCQSSGARSSNFQGRGRPGLTVFRHSLLPIPVHILLLTRSEDFLISNVFLE